MIDEKKIYKATIDYLEEEGHKPYIEQAFQDGAQWAQQEFIRSLWHDASEKPMAGRHVIALSKKGMFVYDFQFKEDDDNWTRKFQLLHIERWAYLDDILPKEGDEK